MKILFLIIGCSAAFLQQVHASWTEESRRIEAEQVAHWENKLAETQNALPELRMKELWLGLRNMGYRRTDGEHDESVDLIYEKLQTFLLSTPGHAQYFADEVKRRQEEVWENPLMAGGRTSYNSDRALYFGVIAHLPSPEAIKVLGNFLSDDKDTPSERISPNSDYGPNPPANSLYSTYTLIDIGLRDAPVSPKQRDDDQDQILAKTRAWWKEIEGGKRTFSFKGQNVEYRFKPDGTWETLSMANPPDDGPGRPQAGPTRPARRPATDQREPRLSIQVTIIPWLLAFGTFVLATACWWAMRKKP